MSSVEARPSRATAASADRLALRADGKDGQPALARGFDHARRDVAVGVDDRGRAVRQKLAEEAQLGGEIVLDRRVIVHVVAGQIGEGAGGETNAVEPLLVEAVRRGLHREMRDARVGEPIEGSMQLDRVRRRQRSVDGQRARDDADRAERGGLAAERTPDLPDEGRDRGLAAGAGDGDDGFGLPREEARGGARERGAGVGDPDEGRAGGGRRPLADDSHGPARERVADMLEAVVLRSGEREEDVARLDLAAVDAMPSIARDASASSAFSRSTMSPSLIIPRRSLLADLVGVGSIAQTGDDGERLSGRHPSSAARPRAARSGG